MNTMTNNNIKLITLVGMMGSGKTSCGSVLSKKLGISFLDIDSIIELEENLKISEIFKKFGEEYFRLIEEKVIFLKVSEYLKLVTSLIIAFGICFQLPVLLTLLAKVGIIGSENLKKGRKYAIVLTFLVAAFLTPPDLISQIGLAIPTLLLYELSILLVSLIEKKNNE